MNTNLLISKDFLRFLDSSNRCIKKLKSKKDYKFITPVKPEKTLKTYLPNEEGIKKGRNQQDLLL